MLQRPPAEWLSRNPGQNFATIHGLAMAPVFWRLYAPSHVRDHNTVAYPLPGHHPWPLEPDRLPLQSDDILDAYARALEEDFDGKPVTLIGHSTGGFMSLLLARHRPDLVRSVVLMGGFACGRFEGRERMAARLLRTPRVGSHVFFYLFKRWISTTEQFRWGSIDCVHDKSCPWETAEALAMMEEVRLHLLQAHPEHICAVINWMHRTSCLDALREISVPVLNLVGARDAIVPPSHQLRVSRLLPNAQTVLFGNAGHLVMVEQQKEVDRIVSRFARDPFLPQLPRTAPVRKRTATAPTMDIHNGVAPAPRRIMQILSTLAGRGTKSADARS